MLVSFTCTSEQRQELEGLAYWISDHARMLEKYGKEEPELIRCIDSIRCCHDACDRLEIPIWVQNAVAAYAENWRRTFKETMRHYLSTRNITL